MAIYHLSVKTISRSSGRSAPAAAAYRAGVEIVDARSGEVHNYRRKKGVEFSEIILPPGAPEWASDRATLWNAAERAETRKNSTVAREFEIALPSELPAEERERLARDLACEIVERHRCAIDIAIHAPGKEGDNRNHHAHILLTTRRLTHTGFTEKTRELDDKKTGEVDWWRNRFATLQNERLCQNRIFVRVDHRTLATQGLARMPTTHLGPALSGLRRRGARSFIEERRASERLEAAMRAGEMERQMTRLVEQIIVLETDVKKAKAEALHRAEMSARGSSILSMHELRARSRAAFARDNSTTNDGINLNPRWQDPEKPR